MNIFPYDTFELILNESSLQVRKRLAMNVEDRAFWELLPSSGTRSFIGRINGNSFKICRDIGYRKYFHPLVCGTIAAHPSGTCISVQLRLHVPVLFFLVCFYSLALVFPPFTYKAGFWTVLLQLAFIIVAPLLIATAGFRREAELSKARFLEIFRDMTDNRPRGRIH